jgi:hypothetical protein
MKICIIGGGFYGCFLSHKLSKYGIINLYEKSPKICQKSATNNQNRLHLGYHYPRSLETIEQVIKNHNDFLNEFSNCIMQFDKNIYAVHENSKVCFKDYKLIFDSYSSISHQELPSNDEVWKLIKNKNVFSGALITNEPVIDTKKLSNFMFNRIYNNKKINLYCNYEVNSENIEQLKIQNDYIINCTGIDPFKFSNKKMEFKNEQCIIPILEDNRYSNMGFTIMDGPFCSLYPVKNNKFSLSSVVHTPFSKKEESFCLKEKINNIINHGMEYFYLENSKVVDYYYSHKTKIKFDDQDQRHGFVQKEEKQASVFPGKLSCCFSILEEIENEFR